MKSGLESQPAALYEPRRSNGHERLRDRCQVENGARVESGVFRLEGRALGELEAFGPSKTGSDHRCRGYFRHNHELSCNFAQAPMWHHVSRRLHELSKHFVIRVLRRYCEAAVDGLEGKKRWPSLLGKPVVGPARSARASWRLRTKKR